MPFDGFAPSTGGGGGGPSFALVEIPSQDIAPADGITSLSLGTVYRNDTNATVNAADISVPQGFIYEAIVNLEISDMPAGSEHFVTIDSNQGGLSKVGETVDGTALGENVQVSLSGVLDTEDGSDQIFVDVLNDGGSTSTYNELFADNPDSVAGVVLKEHTP